MTLSFLKMSTDGIGAAPRVAIAGMLVVAALSLTGCGAIAGTGVPNASANAAVASYGHAIGSGEKVQSELGSYERITADPSVPQYTYAESTALMNEVGFTAQDSTDAQRLVVDYMVREFIDSSALNGGDKAYNDWFANTAPKYFAENSYKAMSLNPSDGIALIGNNNGTGVPNLIHDGAPRVKNVDLNVSGFRPFSEEGGKYVKYSIQYKAAYRVDDKNAAALAAKYGNMSVADFLAANNANPKLKDNTGENVFGASGNVNFYVGKDEQGVWKVNGLEAEVNFDTSDFAQN
jgi:hypothetical protein